MKLFQLLLSLFLAILLCTAPFASAQTAPTVPTAKPTPPTGAPGTVDDDGPPPAAPSTVPVPTVITEYPNYAA